jgi:hypothetical protein
MLMAICALTVGTKAKAAKVVAPTRSRLRMATL